MKYVINDHVVLLEPPEGPLAGYIRPFASWVSEQGYGRDGLLQRIRIASGFSQWLGARTLRLADVRSGHCARYLRYRARCKKIQPGDAFALSQLRAFLGCQGVIPAEKPAPGRLTAVERCTREFEQYLREQRMLAEATIVYYLPFVGSFLKSCFGAGPVRLSSLRARDVVRFVQRQAPRLHRKRAQLLTTALRSFLRYGCYRGKVRAALLGAVPCVANWSLPLIPRAIEPRQVRRVLQHIDRTSPTGLRDYAILLLLARLGLRASEIVYLQLEDIDWKAGRLSARGKGGRRIELPLPQDVGDAIVAYLQDGRVHTHIRRVFLRAKAPVRGFLGASAVSTIVRHALRRAGVEAPSSGAHQFRHGLASEMLRHGASLGEIGELLGHRSAETTKIYAKIDLNSLRALALPWPGGVR